MFSGSATVNLTDELRGRRKIVELLIIGAVLPSGEFRDLRIAFPGLEQWPKHLVIDSAVINTVKTMQPAMHKITPFAPPGTDLYRWE